MSIIFPGGGYCVSAAVWENIGWHKVTRSIVNDEVVILIRTFDSTPPFWQTNSARKRTGFGNLNEPRNQMDPNWSPDGNSVIFSYFPIFDRVPAEKLGVYIVDLKTRKVKKLPGSDGLWAPRWSPDASHIVARSADSRSLMLFDFAAQTWSELATESYVGFANWSANGRPVFYMRRGGQPAVLRVTITNRKVEEIVSLKDLRQTGFRGAIWTGLTPDDSPLFLRDIGTQEIYALDLQVR